MNSKSCGKIVTAPVIPALGCGEGRAEFPKPQTIPFPGSSQSLRNSSRLNPLTWPMRPFKSLLLWATSSSRSPGFLEVPSPSRAALPARERISDPSATISLVHRNIFTSISAESIDCCLVKLAWSVQQSVRIGPSTFFWARLPASWAKPSRTSGDHAC